MIWHFLEVWGLLLVAFALGCLLGTLLYMALATSPLANAQLAAADSIAGGLGGLRRRVGGGRDSGGYRQPAESDPYTASPPEAYPAAHVIPQMDDVEPVAQTVGAIDEALGPLEPLESLEEEEWDEQAYWDDEPDEPAALDSTPPPPAFPVERSIPVPTASVPLPQEQELRSELPAMRPLTLPGPRNGVPDNLQRIRGIGQKNEELLNSVGIYHFGQIAAWTPAEARWVASHLAFPERIERDDWIGQAIILATGGDTGYVKAADRRKGGGDPPVSDS